MSFIIDDKLLNQLRMVCVEHGSDVSCSILIGTIDSTINEVAVLSAIHYPRIDDQKNIKLVMEELMTLKSMLPYNLNVIGLAFYNEDKPSKLAQDILKMIKANFLVNVQQLTIDYYQITDEKITSLKAQTYEIPIENHLSFIHTIEFETSDDVLDNQTKMKKEIFSGLDLNWDKACFSHSTSKPIEEIQLAKNPIDRIIEIQIPCEDKNLSTSTSEGNVFLAFDLHINYYVKKSQKSKQLQEIIDDIYAALKQDIRIKLQRSVFDDKIKRLVSPMKVPIYIDSIELNGYLSLDATSKYEFELCKKLITHATIIDKLGKLKEARILFNCLIDYFKHFNDQTIYLQIKNTMESLSKS
ncbi:MAG: hypothetical protein FK733_01165 [Asgard group archaeon]|nr:hypothetical protein [Asgard group archaeon]